MFIPNEPQKCRVDNKSVKFSRFLYYGEAASNYVPLICMIVPLIYYL